MQNRDAYMRSFNQGLMKYFVAFSAEPKGIVHYAAFMQALMNSIFGFTILALKEITYGSCAGTIR